MTDTTRRTVMLGAGGAGLAVALSACSGYSTGSNTADAPTAESPRPAGEATDNGGGNGTGDSGGGADALAKTADIPEGGGKVFESEKLVVTQPQAGTFKAFTAVCTHQGCTVASVSNGTINCPCHGSKFNIADGSVANGPATKPLAEKQIKVSGDSISLG
ncbi:Rieske (2Fe-2S) protein [Streptosporangiaceae bacterium NEAU-GS5]|nr:Rieske (2Fe-2S) protein [Streptosporangiaceae bacterium NEAU-GS5]